MGRPLTYKGKSVAALNPGVCPVARKPVAKITDRAKRYRANQPACLPSGPRVCAFCPSRRNVEVHHGDGVESNGKRSNLFWACRSCNTRIGKAMAAAGKGTRTRQFNPKARGADGLTQYAWAISQICRRRDEARGDCSRSRDPLVLEAVQIIRDTPASKRRQFARLASARRARGRRDAVPF